MTNTIYHIQSTKPRSETGARPESVFFAWFVVIRKEDGRCLGKLHLHNQLHSEAYYSTGCLRESSPSLFRGCVRTALSTYGTEPCAAIRKKIAKLGEICSDEASDLPALLKNAGFSVSVLEL